MSSDVNPPISSTMPRRGLMDRGPARWPAWEFRIEFSGRARRERERGCVDHPTRVVAHHGRLRRSAPGLRGIAPPAVTVA